MFFCRFPGCPRLYCSTDGVRKHARKSHRTWLEALDSEMDPITRGRKRSEQYCDVRELTPEELDEATAASGTCKRPRRDSFDPPVPAALSALAARSAGHSVISHSVIPHSAPRLVRQDSLGISLSTSEVPVLNLDCPSPVDFVSHKPAAEVAQEQLPQNIWNGLPPVKRGASFAEINIGEMPADPADAAWLPSGTDGGTPAPNDLIDGWWL